MALPSTTAIFHYYNILFIIGALLSSSLLYFRVKIRWALPFPFVISNDCVRALLTRGGGSFHTAASTDLLTSSMAVQSTSSATVQITP